MRKLPLLLVALLAMSGCSGGKAAPAAITKADFLKRGNAICTTMNTKSNALQDPGQDPVKLKQVVDASIPITADGVSQLRALPEPNGDQATLHGFFTKVDKLIGDLRDESAALGANDLSHAKDIATSIQNDSTAANDAANAYGLNVCGAG